MSQCYLTDLFILQQHSVSMRRWNYEHPYSELTLDDLERPLISMVSQFLRIKKDRKVDASRWIISLDCAAFEYWMTGKITAICISMLPNTHVNCPMCQFNTRCRLGRVEDDFIAQAKLELNGATRMLYVKRHLSNKKRLVAFVGEHGSTQWSRVALKVLVRSWPQYTWFYHFYQRWGCFHLHGILAKDEFDHYVYNETLKFLQGGSRPPLIWPEAVLDTVSIQSKRMYQACLWRVMDPSHTRHRLTSAGGPVAVSEWKPVMLPKSPMETGRYAARTPVVLDPFRMPENPLAIGLPRCADGEYQNAHVIVHLRRRLREERKRQPHVHVAEIALQELGEPLLDVKSPPEVPKVEKTNPKRRRRRKK
jgi:hypothetical protein